jgi:flagellar biosynthesis protein FlhB
MSEEDSGSDKEYEPTQKRLDDAREKGEIPRSPDLTTAAGYCGFLLAVVVFGPGVVTRVGGTGAMLLGQADMMAPAMMAQGMAQSGAILADITLAVAPLFMLPAAAALAMLALQRALIFTPEKVMPKLTRISPLSGLKQKLGRQGLFEFAKSFAKMLIVTAIMGLFLTHEAGRIVAAVAFEPGIVATELMRYLIVFMAMVCVLSGVIGALDYGWQRAEHLRQHRMSRTDLMDELKGSEGDPHVKAQRRQRGQEIATNRMLLDVGKADVVIVNPTHYAVALRWDRGSRRAPVCVAKGVDEVAARIRARAAEAGVPLHRDPPTARMLHAAVEIGAEIRPEHYRAVAAAIRFSEAMRRRRLWKRGTP